MHFKLSIIPLVLWAIRQDVAKMLTHKASQPPAPAPSPAEPESLPADEIANLLECILIKRLDSKGPEPEPMAPPFWEAAPESDLPQGPKGRPGKT